MTANPTTAISALKVEKIVTKSRDNTKVNLIKKRTYVGFVGIVDILNSSAFEKI